MLNIIWGFKLDLSQKNIFLTKQGSNGTCLDPLALPPNGRDLLQMILDFFKFCVMCFANVPLNSVMMFNQHSLSTMDALTNLPKKTLRWIINEQIFLFLFKKQNFKDMIKIHDTKTLFLSFNSHGYALNKMIHTSEGFMMLKFSGDIFFTMFGSYRNKLEDWKFSFHTHDFYTHA